LVPPGPAALLTPTIHDVELPATREAELQLRLLTVTGATTVTAPPLAVIGRPSPAEEAANALEAAMDAVPASADMVSAIDATWPFGMGLLFIPFATHVIVPALAPQKIALPDAAREGPAVTDTLATLAVG